METVPPSSGWRKGEKSGEYTVTSARGGAVSIDRLSETGFVILTSRLAVTDYFTAVNSKTPGNNVALDVLRVRQDSVTGAITTQTLAVTIAAQTLHDRK